MNIVLKNNMDNYSLEELEREAKVIKADYVDNMGIFALNDNSEPIGKTRALKLTSNKEPKKQPYGNIFKDEK